MNKIIAVLATVIAVSTPAAAAAQDCLSYLAADVAFHDAMAATRRVYITVRAAIESGNEAVLEDIEAGDGGRWKAYVAASRNGPVTNAYGTALQASSEATQAAIDAIGVAAAARAAEAAALEAYRVELNRARSDAWFAAIKATFDAETAEREAAYDAETAEAVRVALRPERNVPAYEDLWLPAARGQLVAAYAEAYAAGGRDIDGRDIDLVFTATAHERQTACPDVGNPDWPEPLEILARY